MLTMSAFGLASIGLCHEANGSGRGIDLSVSYLKFSDVNEPLYILSMGMEATRDYAFDCRIDLISLQLESESWSRCRDELYVAHDQFDDSRRVRYRYAPQDNIDAPFDQGQTRWHATQCSPPACLSSCGVVLQLSLARKQRG